jgi:XTP/dITP diphosphohydrolase
MHKIVLASSNQGKLRELQAVLAPIAVELIPQNRFDLVDADETGLTFVENAIIKARHAAQITGLPALADDSGLCVDALNGAPGIYSARYSGESATDATNNQKLLTELQASENKNRAAQFHCVLVLMRHATDPIPLIAHGTWAGEILEVARGDNGFGYDPLFFCPALQASSAELSPAVKNRVSHRAQALVKLVKNMRATYDLTL